MKLLVTYLLVLATVVQAWTPFKHVSEVSTAEVVKSKTARPIEVGPKFNPQELLDSRKPKIYTEALLRLKRLEDEPICHRVAAQLLMNNCRGLDEINEHTYQLNSDHIQRHHVESFTASLTICEMERSALFVPEPCSAFSSAALFQHARENKGKLEVSPEQVGDCMVALAHDQSSLMLWVSYRNSAMMFCRAARLDLEKDQHILLHKELAQNMQKFSEAVHDDLEMVRKKMGDNAKAADAYLETFLSNADDWKAKLQSVLQSLSTEAEDVGATMNSIVKNSGTVAHMMKQLVQTIYASTAEVSAKQEHALQASTTHIETQMGDVSRLMGATEESLAVLGAIISHRLTPVIVSLAERQDVLNQRSQAALDLIMNATNALQGHTHKLNEASRSASDINEKLQQAAENAELWKASLDVRMSVPDWTLRTWIPVGVVALGNFGHAASLMSNLKLCSSGLIISEVIISARHSLMYSAWNWWNSTLAPRSASSFTQRPRESQESFVSEPNQHGSPNESVETKHQLDLA